MIPCTLSNILRAAAPTLALWLVPLARCTASSFASPITANAVEPLTTHHGASVPSTITDDWSDGPKARVVGTLLGCGSSAKPTAVLIAVFDLDRDPQGAVRLAQSHSRKCVLDNEAASQESGRGEFPAPTMRDGRFVLEVPRHWGGAARELSVSVMHDAEPWFSDAWAELPTELGDEFDVGALQLKTHELLLRGSITDEDGHPIDSVDVVAEPDEVDVWGIYQRYPWRVRPSATGSEFDVWGWPRFGSMRVRLWAVGYDPLAATLRVGADDARLTMKRQRSGSITAHIADATSREWPSYVGELTRRSDGRMWSARPLDYRIDFRPLEAGTYDLKVRLTPSGDIVQSIAGLEVGDGTSCNDSRLHSLTVADGPQRATMFRVRHADGTPWTFRTVRIEGPAGLARDVMATHEGWVFVEQLSESATFWLVLGDGQRVPVRDQVDVVLGD